MINKTAELFQTEQEYYEELLSLLERELTEEDLHLAAGYLLNLDDMLQYRVTVAGAEGEPLDEGIVADVLLEMGVGYDAALQVFEKRQVNI